MNLPLVPIVSLLLALWSIPGEKYEPTTLVFPPKLHVWLQKANATHLRMYTRNRVKVENPQGVAVTRLDSWEDPDRTEDDDEITVYGVNSGYDMIIYNTSKTALSFYGMNEKGEQRLRRPHGIAAHRSGEVYVADTGNDRVVHLFNPGKRLEYVASLSHLSAPRDVALSPDRTVYVADTGNNRIVVYKNDRLVRSWGENGEVEAPVGIAATDASDRWSYFKDAFVIVIDQNGRRIQKFSPDGRLLARRTLADLCRSHAELRYCAIDYYSNIYITDVANHCIHKFDRNLTYLTGFGRPGSGNKEFDEPRGIGIYKRFGQVIIAERRSVQYYWIGTDVFDFDAAITENGKWLAVDYFLTETSYVTLEVLDGNGNELATPLAKSFRLSGEQHEKLNGAWHPVSHLTERQAHNPRVPSTGPIKPGKYTIRLTIQPTYSSYKRFKKTVETEVVY